MGKRKFTKLGSLIIIFLFTLSLTACTPEIHIHNNEPTTKPVSDPENTGEKTPHNNINETTENTVSDKEPTPSVEDSEPSENSTTNNTEISHSKAKSIALKDAGLTENDIHDYEIELEYDDKILHYEISFEHTDNDYKYEINAKTGAIIKAEKPKGNTSKAKITSAEAKDIALKDAGVNESQISDYEIELEEDDGLWEYEISFDVKNIEYEYEINAENGKIIKSKKDIDD